MSIPFLRDPVRKAQKLIATGIGQTTMLGDVIETIVRDELWRTRRSATGSVFSSWVEFVTSAQPHGLGICTQEAMDEIGVVLHKCRLYGLWRDLLVATTRKRGRPNKNLAISENKIPRFELPRSHGARAKQVMLLAEHHPSIFAELKMRELSLAGAVQKAGLVRQRTRRQLRFGVLDLNAARSLSERAQKRLLHEVYMAVGVDAQCSLLANVIGPGTSAPELAKIWRSRSAKTDQPHSA
jgi:hypothetical protein